MRIIVDAMGGDNAPGAAVRGAVRAARELNTEITLVGRVRTISGRFYRPRTTPM